MVTSENGNNSINRAAAVAYSARTGLPTPVQAGKTAT